MTGASATHYWENRAQRFAHTGEGLAAVCSYGMPGFYNWAIQLTQRLALAPWLHVPRDAHVLDVGCGVGRWSRLLAARGARVTGIDLSPTMVSEASRRADVEGVASRCTFAVGDICALDLNRRFDLVIGVTVLQHILEPVRLQSAVSRLAAHLAPSGRLVLLEAAPARRVTRCDTPIFQARDTATYLSLFAASNLRVEAITGVDPSPFRPLFLPSYKRLPPTLAKAALGVVTAASLPIDLLAGRAWVSASWHKVFVLQRAATDRVTL